MMAAHGRPTVAAIVVAAGSGERLGAGVPKALVEIGGQVLMRYSIERFAQHERVRDIVLVLPPGDTGWWALTTVVVGGATRQESVAAGLRMVAPDVDFVLVHDAARPFVPDAVVDAVLDALEAGSDAVVPVVPIIDTVRRVGPDGALAGVLDRTSLVAVQTPQGFRRDVLVAAHAQAGRLSATDDAALAEALGVEVVAVPGADENFKITTPSDLARAESVARLHSAQHSPIPGGMS